MTWLHATPQDTLTVVADAKEQEGNFCLSWCPSKFHPAMLAIGCGRENTVKVRCDAASRWDARGPIP